MFKSAKAGDFFGIARKDEMRNSVRNGVFGARKRLLLIRPELVRPPGCKAKLVLTSQFTSTRFAFWKWKLSRNARTSASSLPPLKHHVESTVRIHGLDGLAYKVHAVVAAQRETDSTTGLPTRA
jgi:hypothetical protein